MLDLNRLQKEFHSENMNHMRQIQVDLLKKLNEVKGSGGANEKKSNQQSPGNVVSDKVKVAQFLESKSNFIENYFRALLSHGCRR